MQRQTPSVPITESSLQWRPVRVQTNGGAPIIQHRLILVNAAGAAMDGNFGVQMSCRIVTGFINDQGRPAYRPCRPDDDFIDIRVISCRQAVARNGNRSVAIGPHFVPVTTVPPGLWTPMVCSNDLDRVYFARGGMHSRVERRDAIVYEWDMTNPQTRSVLILAGLATPIAIELERDDLTRAQLLQTAIHGEVRLVFVMQPPEAGDDGVYNLIADRRLLDPLRIYPNFAGVAALKVIKHSSEAIPAETQVLRTDPLYYRENPTVEIEMMALIAACPNPDPETCLYTWPTDRSPILPAPLYTGHQSVMWMLGLFGDAHNMYVLLPYVEGGDLQEALVAAPGHRYTDADAIECMRQVTSAVNFLHSVGIAHLDISRENIMLHTLTNRPVGNARRFVLIDFGQAVWHADVGGAWQLLPPRPIGTAPGKIHYYCPDTFLATIPYSGSRIDCWQLGILVIFITTGSEPFRFVKDILQPGTPYNQSVLGWFQQAQQALHTVAVRSPAGVLIPLHTAVTAPCMDFLRGTIVIRRNQRWTIRAIMAHLWLNPQPAVPVPVPAPPAALPAVPVAPMLPAAGGTAPPGLPPPSPPAPPAPPAAPQDAAFVEDIVEEFAEFPMISFQRNFST